MLVWLSNSLPDITSLNLHIIPDLLFQCLPYKNINPDLFLKGPSTQQLVCNNIHRECYARESTKKYYETSGWYTLPDSCNKGLVASWADNSMQFNMFKISWWIYPPSAFLIASILVSEMFCWLWEPQFDYTLYEKKYFLLHYLFLICCL